MTRRRPPKIITRVIVFLLLGAIVNVAIAWGCVILDDPSERQISISHAVSCGSEKSYWVWQLDVGRRRGTTQFNSAWCDWGCFYSPYGGIGNDQSPQPLVPDWAAFLIPPDKADTNGMGHTRLLTFAGWPIRAMWSMSSNDSAYGSVGSAATIHRGIELASQSAPFPPRWPAQLAFSRALPIAALWPGFAINTIFYAAMLWVLFFAPGSVRRAFRRRRGLCPACAYPVGTSPVCTECGKPAKQSAISGQQSVEAQS